MNRFVRRDPGRPCELLDFFRRVGHRENQMRIFSACVSRKRGVERRTLPTSSAAAVGRQEESGAFPEDSRKRHSTANGMNPRSTPSWDDACWDEQGQKENRGGNTDAAKDL